MELRLRLLAFLSWWVGDEGHTYVITRRIRNWTDPVAVDGRETDDIARNGVLNNKHFSFSRIEGGLVPHDERSNPSGEINISGANEDKGEYNSPSLANHCHEPLVILPGRCKLRLTC